MKIRQKQPRGTQGGRKDGDGSDLVLAGNNRGEQQVLRTGLLDTPTSGLGLRL